MNTYTFLPVLRVLQSTALILFFLINLAFCSFGFSQFPNQSQINTKECYEKSIDIIETGLSNFAFLLKLMDSLETGEEFSDNLYQIMNIFSSITFAMKFVMFCKAVDLISQVSEDVLDRKEMLMYLNFFFTDSKFLSFNKSEQIKLKDVMTKLGLICFNVKIDDFLHSKDEAFLKSYRYIIRQYFTAYNFIFFNNVINCDDYSFIYLILSTLDKEELDFLCRIDDAIGTIFYEKFVRDKEIDWGLIANHIKEPKKRVRTYSGYMGSDAGSLDLNVNSMKSHCLPMAKCMSFINEINYTDLKLVLKKSLDAFSWEKNGSFGAGSSRKTDFGSSQGSGYLSSMSDGGTKKSGFLSYKLKSNPWKNLSSQQKS